MQSLGSEEGVIKLKVSVLIPNWNGLELLKKSLPSLGKQVFQKFEVIIVDNGSTDESVPYVKKNFPKFKVIELKENIGFSPAMNLAIKESRGEYLILLNNDTEIDKNCLNFLVESADRHQDVGMIAAKMLNFHNRKLIDSAGDYIDEVGHANNIGLGEYDSPRFNVPGYIFLVTGGGSLFKKKVFDQVGLFDNDYFAYFEDVDICFRAQIAGFKAWYEPRAIIYHIHKATSRKNTAFTEYLQFRNMTMTIIKDFPMSLMLKNFNWLKIILVNLNTVRFLGSCGYLIPAFKAECYIIFHFFGLLKKRRKIQAGRKVDNAYINSFILEKKITFFGLFK